MDKRTDLFGEWKHRFLRMSSARRCADVDADWAKQRRSASASLTFMIMP